ncbi:MAG: hypothetical protein MR519_04310 [Spirochaetaceae bacterium]|nr:hypothetical protein [Spirochaetaceae bacterium]
MGSIRLFLVLLLYCTFTLGAEAAYLRLAVPSGEKHPIGKASIYLSHQCDWEPGADLHLQVAGPELGSESEVLIQLRFGGISMMAARMETLCDAVPSLKHVAGTLRQLEAKERKPYCLSHWPSLVAALETKGIHPLAVLEPEMRCLYTNGTTHIETMQGTTIGVRSGSSFQERIQRWGAIPFSSDPNDFSTLLSSHQIDAVEDGFLDLCLSPTWAFARTLRVNDRESLPSLLVVSSRVWDSLDARQQALLGEATRKASLYGDTLIERAQADWLELARKEKQLVEGDW